MTKITISYSNRSEIHQQVVLAIGIIKNFQNAKSVHFYRRSLILLHIEQVLTYKVRHLRNFRWIYFVGGITVVIPPVRVFIVVPHVY